MRFDWEEKNQIKIPTKVVEWTNIVYFPDYSYETYRGTKTNCKMCCLRSDAVVTHMRFLDRIFNMFIVREMLFTVITIFQGCWLLWSTISFQLLLLVHGHFIFICHEIHCVRKSFLIPNKQKNIFYLLVNFTFYEPVNHLQIYKNLNNFILSI